jgi:hypothetical protein
MAQYKITFKGKDSRQVMYLLADSEDEAKQAAEEAQARRHGRFPLTFQRLDMSLAQGEPVPLLGVDTKGGEFSKQLHKAQTELRKRDQARYDDNELKITKVEKVGD